MYAVDPPVTVRHFVSVKYSVNPIVIYCFELSRSTDHLRKFYDGCGRTDITCDAYISYPTLEKETDGLITVTGCYDHARRRLVDAFRISYHKGMSREAVDDMIEMQGIILVNRIYLEEYKLSELSAHERYLKRQGEVKKAVNDFFGFMHGIEYPRIIAVIHSSDIPSISSLST